MTDFLHYLIAVLACTLLAGLTKMIGLELDYTLIIGYLALAISVRNTRKINKYKK
jgi:hypothetical protein